MIHFLAICKSTIDHKYFLTNHLYSSAEEAREDLGESFCSLWNFGANYPRIWLDKLEKKEEEKKQENKSQDEWCF